MRKSVIWYIEKNIYGAWVICGEIGIRQYYYYTKREAMSKYRYETSMNQVECVN